MIKFIIKETKESFDSIHELRQHALFEQVEDYTLIVREDKKMTEGISKKRLREWKRIAVQKGIDGEILDLLIKECKELNPWLPIDENTPKDRELLLFYSGNESSEAFCWIKNEAFCWIKKYDTSVGVRQPTHWQELPENPKEE